MLIIVFLILMVDSVIYMLPPVLQLLKKYHGKK